MIKTGLETTQDNAEINAAEASLSVPPDPPRATSSQDWTQGPSCRLGEGTWVMGCSGRCGGVRTRAMYYVKGESLAFEAQQGRL